MGGAQIPGILPDLRKDTPPHSATRHIAAQIDCTKPCQPPAILTNSGEIMNYHAETQL